MPSALGGRSRDVAPPRHGTQVQRLVIQVDSGLLEHVGADFANRVSRREIRGRDEGDPLPVNPPPSGPASPGRNHAGWKGPLERRLLDGRLVEGREQAVKGQGLQLAIILDRVSRQHLGLRVERVADSIRRVERHEAMVALT